MFKRQVIDYVWEMIDVSRRSCMKRKYFLLIQILLIIIAILIIPFNMFYAKFSEWGTIIPLIGIVVNSLVYYRTYRRVGKILLIITTILVIGVVYIGSFANPYWNSSTFRNNINNGSYKEILSFNQAKADLEETMKYIEKCHPLYIHGLSTDIEQRYIDSINRLKNKNVITSIDIEREIQLIVAPLGDAHTTSYPSYYDDLYLKDSAKLQNDGWSINKINGLGMDEIVEQAKKYICYEVEEGVSIDLNSYSTLLLYNIASETNIYEWVNCEGETLTKEYTIEDYVEWEKYSDLLNEYSSVDDLKDKNKTVYYTLDEEKSLAILTLKSCKYNAEYRECVKQMFQEVKDKKIENIAIDLRNNSGGSSLVANEVFRYLPVKQFNTGACDWRLGPFLIHNNEICKSSKVDDLIFDGEFYVLSNAQTFSSAKDFAMMVVDNNIGTLIGEPPANSCYGYGEVTCFNLKNSGVYIQISTKKWYRADLSNKDILVRPNILCNGEDVLQTLYQTISNK